MFIVGGDFCPVYEYPLKETNYSMYMTGSIDLKVKENGNKLIGNNTIIFVNSGECRDGFRLLYDNGKKRVSKLNTKINISPSATALQIESNRRMLALTLVLIAFSIISLVSKTEN